MITWLPASVVISEYRLLQPIHFIRRRINHPIKMSLTEVTTSFNNFLVLIVINLRWIWLLLLTAIAIGSCYIVFKNPGLQLPDSPDFQLFHSGHIFEKYDLIYARKFWFERRELVSTRCSLFPSMQKL